ncbi:MAG: Rrf2 family transcriptional regulator [Candidatus Hydrogenedentes bacterium]|nr:Rrf2 family transcriptional regulator [Candidatus Hydrogenedentota bacterium]
MISRTALHTLRAVVALAERPGEFQGAAHIAEQIGAPQNYLGKLLQGLVQEGIVVSQKGMGGGFCLARKPTEITLYDVVNPVDHVARWEGCFMGRPACDANNPCAVHHEWAAVRNAYLKMLKGSTLADVVDHEVALTLP